jgi:hypothetical protein
MDAAQEMEYATMRAPKDVVRVVKLLAALDGKSVHEWSDTDFRQWVNERYKERIAQENKGHELGGES